MHKRALSLTAHLVLGPVAVVEVPVAPPAASEPVTPSFAVQLAVVVASEAVAHVMKGAEIRDGVTRLASRTK